jgi:hypothetical protein
MLIKLDRATVQLHTALIDNTAAGYQIIIILIRGTISSIGIILASYAFRSLSLIARRRNYKHQNMLLQIITFS